MTSGEPPLYTASHRSLTLTACFFISSPHPTSTNILYKVSGWSFLPLISEEKKVYFLGQCLLDLGGDVEESMKELASRVQSLIWITYRRNFPPLLGGISASIDYISDTGWGCMVRVG